MTAGLDAAFISSGGRRLLGGFYRAAGGGPGPAALLLHGLPGHEKNLDVAVELRQVGVHVLYLHYRGAWGSEGDYSCAHLVPDAAAALDWLAARPQVDPSRVALIGFSLGGWVACSLAAQRPPAALVAVAPLVDARQVSLPGDLAEESAATLHGTTAERLTTEWASLRPLNEVVPSLTGVPFLLVTGDHDTLFPPAHFEPLLRLPRLSWIQFPRADHVFTDVRPGLRHVITRWLLDELVG